MISLNNIKVINDNITVIDNLSMNIPEGQLSVILGKKNSGKTAMAKMLSKLYKPNSGNIYINNENYYEKNIRIASVFNEVNQNLFMTINEYLTFFAKLYNIDDKIIKKNIDYWLNFTNFSAFKNADISLLNNDERKIINILRALVVNPEILIMDSIFASVSNEYIKKILNIIVNIGTNVTLLIFERDLNYLSEICENLYIIENGKICISGEFNEVLKNINVANRIELIFDEEREKVISILNSINCIYNVISESENVIYFSYDNNKIKDYMIIKQLVDNNIKIKSFRKDNYAYNNIIDMVNFPGKKYILDMEEM